MPATWLRPGAHVGLCQPHGSVPTLTLACGDSLQSQHVLRWSSSSCNALATHATSIVRVFVYLMRRAAGGRGVHTGRTDCGSADQWSGWAFAGSNVVRPPSLGTAWLLGRSPFCAVLVISAVLESGRVCTVHQVCWVERLWVSLDDPVFVESRIPRHSRERLLSPRRYPHCLQMLTLLQQEAFRKEVAHAQFAQFADDQQVASTALAPAAISRAPVPICSRVHLAGPAAVAALAVLQQQARTKPGIAVYSVAVSRESVLAPIWLYSTRHGITGTAATTVYSGSAVLEGRAAAMVPAPKHTLPW